jgi:hypothetical protein
MDPKPNEAHVLVRQKGAMAERHLPHLRQPNQEGHGVSFRLKRRRGQAAAIRRVSSDLAPGDGAVATDDNRSAIAPRLACRIGIAMQESGRRGGRSSGHLL